MSWEEIKLSDLAEFRNGVNFSKDSFGNGINVINVSDFKDRRIPDYDSLPEINPEGIVTVNDLLSEDDILFVRSNGNKDLVGRSLFIENIQKDVTFSGFSIRCRFTEKEKILPKFYAYLFKTNIIRQQLSNTANGANITNLNQGILGRLELPLPPLPTQKKIASILSTYDDLIENNLKRIQLLEEAAQRIYKEWFVDFKFPNHENTPINPETGLPDGWEYVKSQDVFNINIGKTPPRKQSQWFSTKEGVKWVSISDINKSSNYVFETKERITKEGVEKFNVKVVPENTVLLSFKLTVGSVVITTEDMVTNEAIAHFNIDENSSSTIYTYLYLKNFSYSTLGSTSSIGNALNSKIVKSLPFLKVPNALEDEFVIKTNSVFNNIKNLLKQNQNLKEARDLLLPRLMNRTIEV